MHGFEVHSNESACRKNVRLGMEQVIPTYIQDPKGKPVMITTLFDSYHAHSLEIGGMLLEYLFFSI